MQIKIYGAGCQKCTTLYENTKQAVTELDIECNVEKVTDFEKIMEAGVMLTPALTIDGEIKFSNKVPSVEELKAVISG